MFVVCERKHNLDNPSDFLGHPCVVTCEYKKELINAPHLFRHFLHSNESKYITKAPRMQAFWGFVYTF